MINFRGCGIVPGVTRAQAVESDRELPPEADAVVIGGGMLYGLTMAAGAGEARADMVTGEAPKFDISPYRYERFTDGSEFVFHP